MKDYLSVQQFSKLSGIETSTLRYWDEMGLFSPIKRNPENHYRYYSLAQLLALNFVTTLSDLDIPLKTIADLRHERNPESLLRLLEKQEKQLDMQLGKLRERSSIIHARRELINYGLKAAELPVSVLFREDKELILWPPNEYEEGDTFIDAMSRFVNRNGEYRINLSFPVGGYHNSMESFLKAPALPDRFFSIDPLGSHIRKAGNYLLGFSRGYYAEFGDLPAKMDAYARENELDIAGPVYTIYLHDEICTQDSELYLAQSCIAVVPKEEEEEQE
jgi:DNA-binding transcriptional MerR regulator